MSTVELAYRCLGGEKSKSPVILLHGLLGSARNWQTAGRLLTDEYAVYALDLRNHGESPHHPEMNYPAMCADLLSWVHSQGFSRVHLVGHSMGGKVAMYLASRFPEKVISLTVVDIAPRAYPPRWEREFHAMLSMPVSQMSKRSEAEQWLERDVRDWAFRKFLVSNLERDPDGGFRWGVNLEVLQSALPDLLIQVPADGWQFSGKTLFVRGAKSDFIRDEDNDQIKQLFPFAKLETVEDASHNVHFDQPEAFMGVVKSHLKKAV